MNRNKDATNGRFVRNTPEKIQRLFDTKFSKFELIGEYDDVDGYLYLRCKDCGYMFKRSAQVLRNRKRTKKVLCKRCEEIHREGSQRANEVKKVHDRERDRDLKKMAKIGRTKFKQIRLRICPVCKSLFLPKTKDQKYCSPECSGYVHSKKKDAYRYLVPLSRLYKRDHGICWICGEPCDLSDAWEVDGVQYFGDRYPSRDHVIPKSKGGADSWENIRLAHRGCNSRKHTTILPVSRTS